jgi:hypothetical protein
MKNIAANATSILLALFSIFLFTITVFPGLPSRRLPGVAELFGEAALLQKLLFQLPQLLIQQKLA